MGNMAATIPQPPDPFYDTEAERAVLGAMLEDNRAIPKVINILGRAREIFYKVPHQLIYEAILTVYDEKGIVDAFLTAKELERTGELGRAGGAHEPLEIQKSVPAAENVEYYAEIVKQKAVRRNLADFAKYVATLARDEAQTLDEIIDKSEQMLFDIGHLDETRGFYSMSQIATPVLEELNEVFHNKKQYLGVPTGFPDFDILTLGLRPSQLILIAGRPSSGKSVLAQNIARNIGVDQKLSVAFFSLETPKEDLFMRMLSGETGIDFAKLLMGNFTTDDWETITNAVATLSAAPILINDTPRMNIMEIRSESRRLKIEHKDLAVIIVDYLQYVDGVSKGWHESLYERTTEISQSLKALARELEVPVIALSQLSRSVERRSDPRPMLSDLRESGALEQDADIVAFIHRPELYDATAQEGLTELIIKKHRNGPTGEIPLRFIKNQMRFTSITV